MLTVTDKHLIPAHITRKLCYRKDRASCYICKMPTTFYACQQK